jgi:TatA/E family protein of Tat protein translocase
MLAFLVFGAVRLPKIGADLGKMVRSFKRGLDSEEKITVSRENREISDKTSTPMESEPKGTNREHLQKK